MTLTRCCGGLSPGTSTKFSCAGFAGTQRIDPCTPTGHNRFVPKSILNQKDAVLSTILVTGGSGFIGSHCILQILAAGHSVRTTVRNLKREGDVRAMLKKGGAEPGTGSRFFAADLESDAGWPQAVAGCDYVLHVASPFPPSVPKHEDELIVPAREGALRVLRAARDAGVKRVVLTSSFAAIGYGQKPQYTPFNETNWTDPTGDDVQPTRNRRPWPNGRPGISLPGKAADSSLLSSIRSACSARFWGPIIRPRSSLFSD